MTLISRSLVSACALAAFAFFYSAVAADVAADGKGAVAKPADKPTGKPSDKAAAKPAATGCGSPCHGKRCRQAR